jgi:type I restriction enzyme S subunit
MKITNLGQVCAIIAGQSPAGNSYNQICKGTEFHQGKKLFGETILKKSKIHTTDPVKFAKAGDILISVRAPVGPVNFTDRKICVGRGLAIIRAENNIDKNYLFLYLKMNEAKINGKQGATFASITKNEIGEIIIPLPSLIDQRKIVKKLDDVFGKD